ncbi:hypothetical protein B0H14DRAFT_3159750 [Mycena olivaceomarginata]|nr:hypothetical protein B0H14DRAFT_3159750 [Mycena olivaceomarginata]
MPKVNGALLPNKACLSCKKRKTGCDPGEPCLQCSKRREQCDRPTLELVRSRRRSSRSSITDIDELKTALLKLIERMEVGWTLPVKHVQLGEALQPKESNPWAEALERRKNAKSLSGSTLYDDRVEQSSYARGSGFHGDFFADEPSSFAFDWQDFLSLYKGMGDLRPPPPPLRDTILRRSGREE